MLKLLSVLLLAAVAYSQIPPPCFSPQLLTFLAVQYSHERAYFRQYDAEYDFQGQRFAFYEREDSRRTPGREYFHVIILHKENIVYEYNRQSKQCRKTQAGPFHPFGVPPEGRFEGQYYIGGPGEDIQAAEWSDRSDVRRENWLGVFSTINCYPIRTWQRNEQTNETVHTNIFNLVTGIANPALFEPPPACLNATSEHKSTILDKIMKSIHPHKLY